MTRDQQTESDAHMEARLNVEWLREYHPEIADAQATIVLARLWWHYLDEIQAVQVQGGDVVIWVREDYWANGVKWPHERLHIIEPSGECREYHGHPKGRRHVELVQAITKILNSGKHRKGAA